MRATFIIDPNGVLRGHLPILKGAGVFLAALIPFGGLWSHRMLARPVAACRAK